MVYCVKCGVKNPDDAKVCSQCGTQLYQTTHEYRRKREGECFGPEEECFGIPRGGAIVTVFIGLIIVLAGLSSLLSDLYRINIPWWPFIVIIFGALVIVGAIYRLSRR